MSKTMTLRDAVALTGQSVLAHLDRQASVPVVTTAACQGDVSILRVTTAQATTPMPHSGVPVVRGEAGGNTHSLHGGGFFDWVDSREGLTLGTLTVPDGVDVLMSHPEHGALLIAPGTYRIGRQREFAGEWRMVAD